MRISIDWFIDANNTTSTAHAAYHETSSDFEALEWLKSVVKEHNVDEEHVSQIVVDGYNREDLKLCLFHETTFVVSRKPYEYKDQEDLKYYEYWNGNEPWGDYMKARHYDTKEMAMSIAESLATHCEFVYRVEEIDYCGFVVREYEV